MRLDIATGVMKILKGFPNIAHELLLSAMCPICCVSSRREIAERCGQDNNDLIVEK